MRALPQLACFLQLGLLLATAPGAAPAVALESKCPVESGGCWIELANKPGCHVRVEGRRSAHE